MSNNLKARFATLAALKSQTVPLYLNPIPCDKTLRAMFRRAEIPTKKANKTARRGGGMVRYSVSAVEDMLANPD